MPCLQSALNRKEELKKELVRKREELEDCLADLAQTKTRLDEKTREAQALTAALDDSRVELEHKDNKLKECVIALEQQSRELQESKAVAADARLRAEQMGAELAKAFAGNEQLQGSMLPEQTNLLQIWQKLQALPQSIREIAALYYNFNELSVFLTQCGQFALLRECWQSCMKKALNGANPEGMAEFLELVLQIYNRAFPDNPCKIITAEPQSAFNIMEHDRMGPMGSAVIKMLLPGLIKPNGEIACKCLVTLV